MCKRCHPLCRTCTGPGMSACQSCILYRWDGECVSVCPVGTAIRGDTRRTCVVSGGNYGGRSNAFYLLPYRDRHHNNLQKKSSTNQKLVDCRKTRREMLVTTGSVYRRCHILANYFKTTLEHITGLYNTCANIFVGHKILFKV